MHSIYREAQFLLSAEAWAHLPPDEGAEVAFVGRSNAGKSSALNVLTRTGLARTSKTPGRTRQINFFTLDAERRLVDLPGYGYAKVPAPIRRRWQAFIEQYLTGRRCLRGLVVVMDARRPLTEQDVQLLEFAAHHGLGLHALLTKADKLSRGAAAATLQRVRAALPPGTQAQLFSALRREGLETLTARLDAWLAFPPSEERQQD
ncbi:YihA family ribosome biogenesis GTP-binding protein [Ectothiorhodospiraceae bacterium 2226]|nr:YihA family ribosome biogenesis GTP-binding protein [Ectothiorhodospiraceae bacterium 2226]